MLLHELMLFHKILCAVDFSDNSREAMHVAAELARTSQATLVLVHIWHSPMWLATPELDMPTASMQTSKLELELSTLEAWKSDARKLGASEVATKLAIGVPWEQIVEAARRDAQIDAIVIGTRGRTGARRVLMGSVAEMVVRHAPCTVTVVRGRRHDVGHHASTSHGG